MAKAKNFWKCAGMRAIRTVAQALIASLGSTALISEVNWAVVASTALMAGLLSILNSIAFGIHETKTEDGEG